MPLILIALTFVTAAMYLRRHFGGGALAALWAITSAVMAVTDSVLFSQIVSRVGSSSSSVGRVLTLAFMLFLMATSFGASALTIHRLDTGEGQWWTKKGFVLGLVAFVVGGAAAYGVVAIMIVLVLSRMAR